LRRSEIKICRKFEDALRAFIFLLLQLKIDFDIPNINNIFTTG
jgi:hypothetical protein